MKILVKIKDDKLSFLNKKKLNVEYKNMLNTNVISNDELVFSDEYIQKNYKILSAFFSELTNTYNINVLSFQTMEVALLIMPIFNKIKNINAIYFDSDEVLPYKVCEKLLKCNNITYISAGYIPQYMFELLDKYDIIPESRNEILYTSGFMELNGLSTYSTLFYKYSVLLDSPITNEDLNDFTTFCKINKYLKNVHINKPTKINLEKIIFILKEYRHKNIRIIIHGDTIDEEVIEYLKKYNKSIKKKYKILIKIKYSEKFIEENIVNETNNTILRACALIMFFLAFGSIGMVFIDNYKSIKEVSKIQKAIETYIVASDTEEITKELQKQTTTPIKNSYIAALMNINSDAVGWLKVNNTNIDYAILQSGDNSYYLEHNIYKEKDPNGWLFLDYENNADRVDDNIIIYGHNRLLNGVMFGTLNKVLYKSWYTNPENQIIRYDTLYGSYEYQIFSIYVIPTTNDYLKTTYLNDDEKMEFFNLIKNRSIYNFDVELNNDSQIITLQTCHDETTKLVVHGVLVKR